MGFFSCSKDRMRGSFFDKSKKLDELVAYRTHLRIYYKYQKKLMKGE